MENSNNETVNLYDNELKKQIGLRISNLRKLNNFTQSDLALKLNYSDKAISKWERGEAIPDVITLANIADLFQVTLDYFVTNDPEPVKPINSTGPNRTVITLLSALVPWLIACIIFTVLKTTIKITYWMAFVWAVPMTTTILLIFNCIWGYRINRFLYISMLVWTIIASTFLQILQSTDLNIWYLFLVGIPGQVAIVLWSQLGYHRKKTK